MLLTPLAGWGAWSYWYRHRPQPPTVDRELFQGVHYLRSVRTSPRPLVVHVVTIRLDAPGLSFLVTPGDPAKPRPLVGKLTTTFLRENKLQLAINGDFFDPWWSNAPWDYYPHVGDRVETRGIAVSRGVAYSHGGKKQHWPALRISKDNQVTLGRGPMIKAYNAVAGGPILVTNGVAVTAKHPSLALHPRTAVGHTADRKTLILLLVDGRQPNYSNGVTLSELSSLMVEYGASEAVNLDGGGSATLAIAGKQGPEILNCPIDNHIPGRERPVANHLGIFARPMTN